MVPGLTPPMRHNLLSFGKFQDRTLSYPILSMFQHDWPLVVKSASSLWHLLPTQTWRDSLPIDLLLTAVSVLVVALPRLEVLEGLTN
jgi:hypothetical protein